MYFLLVCVLFYAIGSFPTAYLLVRYKYGRNITEEGSGNIGARNTYDVTNSKLDGIIVLLIDFLKGLIPSIWFIFISDFEINSFILPAALLLLGHNYSVWMKFKGGRGLATAAGIVSVLNFSLIIAWLLLYFVFEKITKNVHIATVIGMILLPLIVILGGDYLSYFSINKIKSMSEPVMFLFSITSVIVIIILSKHVSPIVELMKKKNI